MNDNEILLRLRREYSKDETVAWLSKELSGREVERGKQTSFIQELQDIILTKDRQILELMEQNKFFKAENKRIREKEQIQKMSKEIKKLREEKEQLAVKIYQIQKAS